MIQDVATGQTGNGTWTIAEWFGDSKEATGSTSEGEPLLTSVLGGGFVKSSNINDNRRRVYENMIIKKKGDGISWRLDKHRVQPGLEHRTMNNV